LAAEYPPVFLAGIKKTDIYRGNFLSAACRRGVDALGITAVADNASKGEMKGE